MSPLVQVGALLVVAGTASMVVAIPGAPRQVACAVTALVLWGAGLACGAVLHAYVWDQWLGGLPPGRPGDIFGADE